MTLRALGRHAEATAALEEGHRILQTAWGDAHPSTKHALALISGGRRAAGAHGPCSA